MAILVNLSFLKTCIHTARLRTNYDSFALHIIPGQQGFDPFSALALKQMKSSCILGIEPHVFPFW